MDGVTDADDDIVPVRVDVYRRGTRARPDTKFKLNGEDGENESTRQK